MFRYSSSTWASRLALVLAAALAVAISGCGDGDDGPEAQPVPGASTFQEGNFDQLPRFPGAEGVEEPVVERDVTTQSFTTESATPGRVMDYYERELDEAGWRAAEPPQRIGAERTYRGVWQKGDQELVVSATTFAGFDDPGGGRTTQYSLSLGPL